MRLIGLEIIADGPGGWGSGVLEFGDQITQLFGDNGAGKTPVVQSIVFALGYPANFREDIRRNSSCVVLTAFVSDRCYQFRRYFKGQFLIEVSDALESDAGKVQSFHNESDFSRFLFDLWGCNDPVVTSISGAASRLYVSQLLPVFFLDQDDGYSSLYFAPSKFIKDQHAEVMRSLFKLSAKNPFEQRKRKRELQDGLERLDQSIVQRQRAMERISAEVSQPRRGEPELQDELAELQASFDSLRKGGSAKTESELNLEREIGVLKRRYASLLSQKSEHLARLHSFTVISNEIEVEANTLTLNEEARLVFSSFDSVCANSSCGLFVRSSEAYGKSLLYLKDQLKDLERSRTFHQECVTKFDVELNDAARLIEDRSREKLNVSKEDDAAGLVDATAIITERLISLRRELQMERQLHSEETQYVKDLDERSRTQDELGSLLRGSASVDLNLLRVKAAVEERLRHWLSVLHAVNMPKQVSIDTDFNVVLEGDSFKAIKGSTKTRVVLAVRTAMLEVLLRDASFSPRFFILDTPRQQDIKKDDFANYVVALKELSIKHDAQIVFSSSNYRYEPDAQDKDWPPAFEGVEQDMYLGLPR